MLDPIQTIDFSKLPNQKVPVIIQDFDTQKILTLGYMDKGTLKKTQETGLVNLKASRPKKKKSEEGDVPELKLRQILVDCDKDSLLMKVESKGAVCETGADTCWSERNHKEDFLSYLEQIIALRKSSNDETSYVHQLFNEGESSIIEKFNASCSLLANSGKDVKQALYLERAAEVLFHYMLLLQVKNCTLAEVIGVLQKRHQSK